MASTDAAARKRHLRGVDSVVEAAARAAAARAGRQVESAGARVHAVPAGELTWRFLAEVDEPQLGGGFQLRWEVVAPGLVEAALGGGVASDGLVQGSAGIWEIGRPAGHAHAPTPLLRRLRFRKNTAPLDVLLHRARDWGEEVAILLGPLTSYGSLGDFLNVPLSDLHKRGVDYPNNDELRRSLVSALRTLNDQE